MINCKYKNFTSSLLKIVFHNSIKNFESRSEMIVFDNSQFMSSSLSSRVNVHCLTLKMTFSRINVICLKNF